MDSTTSDLRDAPATFDRGTMPPPPGGWRDRVGGTRRERVVTTPPLRESVRRNWPHLFRAAAFLAVLLSLAFALHAAINAGLRRISTSSFGATNRLVNDQINAQLIITGSSRALVHYDPRILQDATGLTTYNLGRNGSQTDLQLAVLKTYLAHNAKPQLVVHNLDLYSFATSHEIYDPTQYVPYLDEPAIYAGVSRVYADAWKWKYVPLYGYVVPDLRLNWMLGLKRLAGFEPAEDHIRGFTPRQLAWTGDFENLRREHPMGLQTSVEPQGVRDLAELLTVCRDHQVPVILIYSPEYFEIQPLEKNRRVIFALFARLSAQFGATLWDFSDSEISQQRQYFYNSQHLNAAGAAVFSLAVGRGLVAAGFVAPNRSAPE